MYHGVESRLNTVETERVRISEQLTRRGWMDLISIRKKRITTIEQNSTGKAAAPKLCIMIFLGWVVGIAKQTLDFVDEKKRFSPKAKGSSLHKGS